MLLALFLATVATMAAQEPAPRLQEARAARDAGKIDVALSILDRLLAQTPINLAAAELKVEIQLSQLQVPAALTTYDRYSQARGRPDTVFLARIARAELGQLATMPDLGISVPALERLARSGDRAALDTLQTRASADKSFSVESAELLGALTRVSAPDADMALGRVLAAVPSDQKAAILDVIRESGARTLSGAVAALLSDTDPVVRMAAVRTLGVLMVPATIPEVQRLFDTDAVPTVRMFAAIALKRMGQSSADAVVAGLLASDVAEVRLLAGDAYQTSKTTQWMSRIRDLSSDRNEQHRVRAAEILACCDAPTATTILVRLLDSPNPLLRRDAARVLEAASLADAGVARRLLGDADSMVRLRGAGVTLRLAQRAAAGR